MTIINVLKTYFKAPTSGCNLFVGNIPHSHIKTQYRAILYVPKSKEKSIYIFVNDRERKYPLKIN